MSTRHGDDALAATKFAIGQPLSRLEDATLLTGGGRYTDDVNLPGHVYAAIVRSRDAHGIIRGIDSSAARAMPGVLAVITGQDMAAAGYKGMPFKLALTSRDGSPIKKPHRSALALDRVRFVGDPVACVVAETQAAAEEAAEAVVLDIEALDAVVDMRAAVEPGAPQLYEDVPGNVVLDYQFGEPAKVAAAFEAAHHVTRLRLTNARLVVAAMEPRACVAQWDGERSRFTIYAPTQGVTSSQAQLAEIMNVGKNALRFVATNVGGSFGMKSSVFPEYVVALHAARLLGRPVKWTDTRTESFLSDHHGRAQDFDCELALDKDGHFLGIRLDGFGDMGAYLTMMGPLFTTFNVAKHVAGVYRTPVIGVRCRCVVTNTVPITAYRGAGRPEGNYYLERLVDTAAAELGIDPAEIRRRNHIPPTAMPYKAASGSMYDSGNFPALLARALEKSDWAGFAARKRESEARGLLRGHGIGQFLEVTAPVMKELGAIRFQADGTVLLVTGSHDHGQGHWTPLAQVVSQRLGVPVDKIRLMQTDTDIVHQGSGTGGSKSLMSSGTALDEAGVRVIEKAKLAASYVLEAAASDIRFDAGRLTIVGTDRGVGLLDLAQQLASRRDSLPDGCPASLDVDYVHESAPATYPNGCHVAEVEIDPATGRTAVVRYTMVGDFGTVINPKIVAGQLYGGVVQGIGQCLMEETRYTEDGQLASGSFMDYALPHATDVPWFTFDSLPSPATTNPLGVKGCGEAGVAGAVTSVMNAVVDALRPYGVAHVEMPAMPEKVWALIAKGKA